MAPFESQRQWRRVGCGRLDCEFRRQSAGRARFETGYPYLRGVTSGAEWSSVLDACAALIASMFHWVSSYSSGLLGRKKAGQCRLTARTTHRDGRAPLRCRLPYRELVPRRWRNPNPCLGDLQKRCAGCLRCRPSVLRFCRCRQSRT